MRSLSVRLGVVPAVLLLSVAVARAEESDTVTILRDDFGIPHVFGGSERAMAFGMGYAQAEDRLEELCKQYRRCTGTMSEAFGPEFFRDDYRQRLWRHAAIAREKYGTLDPLTRAIVESFQAGIRQYMSEHPEKVPSWALALEPWMCVSLSRYIIWGWPEGNAGGDMQRGGIKPDPIEYHGSNEWLLAPAKTKDKAVIALIDPHLSWYGQFRFYEARLYGGEIAFSGMAILGLPLPSLGHSRFCSVAMTTGGPDAADCYVETINPENSRQYRHGDQWRDMTVVSEIIKVKDGDTVHEKKVEIEYTMHGPVVARKGDKAYTLKVPYMDEMSLLDQGVRMALSRNLNDMKKALSMLQLMEQNVMVGTIDGDIFYVRNGRVPIRPRGLDTTRPIPGDNPANEWQGIHPFNDLIRVHNPPQGYMQNCNVSPQFLMKDCPIRGENYRDRPYLFHGYYGITRRFDNPLHQRAAMCLELLDQAKDVTVEEAIGIANSPAVYGADVWQAKLKKAWEGSERSANLKPFVEAILGWNRRTDPDAKGAVAYRYWKDEMPDPVRLYDKAGFPPHPSVNDKMILDTLTKGAAKMMAELGRYDIPFGEVYRVGRKGGKKTWPVGGGSVDGIATPRAIGFDALPGTKQFIGKGGQTSTQVVQLTRPPKSWTALPLGESDDPASPHFDDQARRLFSHGTMKPTYFQDRPAVEKIATARRTLRLGQPNASAAK